VTLKKEKNRNRARYIKERQALRDNGLGWKAIITALSPQQNYWKHNINVQKVCLEIAHGCDYDSRAMANWRRPGSL